MALIVDLGVGACLFGWLLEALTGHVSVAEFEGFHQSVDLGRQFADVQIAAAQLENLLAQKVDLLTELLLSHVLHVFTTGQVPIDVGIDACYVLVLNFSQVFFQSLDHPNTVALELGR